MTYSKKRIETRLAVLYGLHLQDEHDGEYKHSRYNHYREYSVLDSDNNIIMQHITLQALGDFLNAKNEY